MQYKSSREELVAGDKAVYVMKGYAGTPREAHEVDVKRVTKTRVIVEHPTRGGESSFLKSCGSMVGQSNSWYSDQLCVGYKAEWTLRLGRENMLRDALGVAIHNAEQVLRDTKKPVAELAPILEQALALIKQD